MAHRLLRKSALLLLPALFFLGGEALGQPEFEEPYEIDEPYGDGGYAEDELDAYGDEGEGELYPEPYLEDGPYDEESYGDPEPYGEDDAYEEGGPDELYPEPYLEDGPYGDEGNGEGEPYGEDEAYEEGGPDELYPEPYLEDGPYGDEGYAEPDPEAYGEEEPYLDEGYAESDPEDPRRFVEPDPEPAEDEGILCMEGEPCWEEEDDLADGGADGATGEDDEEYCFPGEPCWNEEEWESPDPDDLADDDVNGEEDEEYCFPGEDCWNEDDWESLDDDPQDMADADAGHEDDEEYCFPGEPCWNEDEWESLDDVPQERRYCAKRLPEDMPSICRARTVRVPDDLDAFKTYFRGWIARCVHESRIEKHVRENAEPLEALFREVQGRESVRVYIDVEPLEFRDNGELCLGVETMRFRLPRKASVDDPDPDPDPDPDVDDEDISDGIDDLAQDDTDWLDRAARDSVNCLGVTTKTKGLMIKMLKGALLAVPLSKLQGRYECLYDGVNVGYPVGVATALVGLPPEWIRHRLVLNRSGPAPGYFDCRSLKEDITDKAIWAGYRRTRALGKARVQAEYGRVVKYISDNLAEAEKIRGQRARNRVAVNGKSYPHEEFVYYIAWGVKGFYGIRKPRNPMQPTSLRKCIEKAIEKATQSSRAVPAGEEGVALAIEP